MTALIRILRAAWVVPVSSPPIADGEVVLEGERILEVRPASKRTDGRVEDFGDAILLPGLVNVHTHLDYTVMRGLLEDLEFFPWIRELTARAATLTEEDWLASATWGAAEAVAGGVTSIGDCTVSGAAFAAARSLGLGGTIYREVFGIDELRPVDEITADLRAQVGAMSAVAAGTALRVGISPHAPYTVRPALFRALAHYAAAHGLPICIHAAESLAEAELLRSGTGRFAEMYARRGIAWSAPGCSTVQYLDELGMLGPGTLLVHGVQVSAADRKVIRDRGVAWAHCPKSNAKLGAGVAPLGILQGRGPEVSGAAPGRVGLGSDSVASNNAMDLFEEMRFAVLMQRASRRKIDAMSARDAVEMATAGGAAALGIAEEAGTLEQGKRADLCVVRLGDLHSAPAYDPYSALVYAARASDVICTVIGGKTRYDARLGPCLARRFPANDLTTARDNLDAAARKMRNWRPTV
jgi:cytosine/adenosine deaminase-related metal-dependent hydrolase